MNIEFIAYILYPDNSMSFIANTSPILWTSNILEAKTFLTIDDCIMELKQDSDQIKASLKNSNIESIWIIPIPYDNKNMTFREELKV